MLPVPSDSTSPHVNSLLTSASNCLWIPSPDGSASAGSPRWEAGRVAEPPAPPARGSSQRKGSRAAFGKSSFAGSAPLKAAIPPRKEREDGQTLFSGNVFRKQSVCILCCPLVTGRQCLYSWFSPRIRGIRWLSWLCVWSDVLKCIPWRRPWPRYCSVSAFREGSAPRLLSVDCITVAPPETHHASVFQNRNCFCKHVPPPKEVYGWIFPVSLISRPAG